MLAGLVAAPHTCEDCERSVLVCLHPYVECTSESYLRLCRSTPHRPLLGHVHLTQIRYYVNCNRQHAHGKCCRRHYSQASKPNSSVEPRTVHRGLGFASHPQRTCEVLQDRKNKRLL